MKLFSVGQRVYHEVYGTGTVFDAKFDLRTSVRDPQTNEPYPDSGFPMLLAVRFDNGGPQGWAEKSNHEVEELEAVQ